MILLITLALAGKLEDGWRGIPYGPAEVLATAPTADCVKGTAPAVKWLCRETVADVPVVVAYMAEEGIYESVVIEANGYAACQTLFTTLQAAWAVPFTPEEHASDILPNGFWNLTRFKTTTSGVWDFNEYSRKCKAITINSKLDEQITARKKIAAEFAAEAL
jgi:hypothetical protein